MFSGGASSSSDTSWPDRLSAFSCRTLVTKCVNIGALDALTFRRLLKIPYKIMVLVNPMTKRKDALTAVP
jgi:hypothetical protein